jgi:hypothetical protein
VVATPGELSVGDDQPGLEAPGGDERTPREALRAWLAFLRKLAAVAVTLAGTFKNVKFPDAEALGNCVNLPQLNIFEDST